MYCAFMYENSTETAHCIFLFGDQKNFKCDVIYIHVYVSYQCSEATLFNFSRVI